MSSSDQILAHLARYGVRDKDARADAARPRRSHSRASVEQIRRGSRLVLDLHGLTEDEAAAEIHRAWDRCAESGIKRVLLIHGQGRHSDAVQGPVLERLVRSMLENELRRSVVDFCGAAPRDGGAGATDVRLA